MGQNQMQIMAAEVKSQIDNSNREMQFRTEFLKSQTNDLFQQTEQSKMRQFELNGQNQILMSMGNQLNQQQQDLLTGQMLLNQQNIMIRNMIQNQPENQKQILPGPTYPMITGK